jgi:hypothetical protein
MCDLVYVINKKREEKKVHYTRDHKKKIIWILIYAWLFIQTVLIIAHCQLYIYIAC